jgi:S1-C subfamily serine protease
MELDDDGIEDAGVFRPPLPPDDRTWLHPSEVAASHRVEQRSAAPPHPWALALVSGLTGALLTTGLIAATGAFDDAGLERVVERVATSAGRTVSDRPDSGSVAAIAERVLPAITQVRVDSGSGGGASGSGVIFRSDGHLLTNNHVVAGARAIRVVLASGEEEDGKLVGTDPDTDIAVVKIGGGPYPTATLGTATELQVGQSAIAIGSPLGLAGGPSVTVGVVSALGRRIDSPTNPPLLDMIQTDAPIAPGSSGGALLDAGGSVIGITTAIAVSDVGAEGLGFATPIDLARSVGEELITTGKVVHVWLGIEGRDVDGQTAKQLGVPGGAMVQNVLEDSPADDAGLEAKDVILSVDGKEVDSMSALIVTLRSHDPGDKVRLGVLRDGKRQAMTVTLAKRPENL